MLEGFGAGVFEGFGIGVFGGVRGFWNWGSFGGLEGLGTGGLWVLECLGTEVFGK